MSDQAADPVGEADVRRSVRSGLRWSLVNQVAARLLSFSSGIALAHLLTPRDFGMFAVALVAIEALQSLNDLGLLTGLVRQPGDVSRVARTGVTLAWSSSLGLFALSLVAAGPFASALHADDATGVLRLLMVAILIDGVSVVPAALLTRAMRQDLRTVADVSGTVVNVIVAVAMASAGAGAWSLAGGRLAGNAVSALIIVLVAPLRPAPGFDRRAARELLDFGLPMAAATVVLYALLNADLVVVGHSLGSVELGLYLLACNLAGWPITLVSATVRRVSLAAFTRLTADRAALARGFANFLTLLLATMLPAYLLLSMLAVPLVEVVYGGVWAQAASILPSLAVLGAVRGATSLADDVLAAAGRSKRTLALHAAWLALLLPALVVGAKAGGLEGVALAQALVAVAMLVPYAAAVQRTGIRLRELGVHLPHLGAALVLAGGSGAALLHVVPGNVARLVVVGTAASVIYTGVVATSRTMRWLVRPVASPGSAPAPLLSVVCVFNDVAVRHRCLDRSLAPAADDPEIEYLPVDNRAGEHPGAGHALNDGARHTRGAVLAFIQQDIHLHDLAALKRAARLLLDSPRLGMLGAVGIDAAGRITGRMRDRVVLLGAHAPDPVDVDSVDEVLFLVPRSLWERLPIDESPELAWHGYAVEYGLRLRDAGLATAAVDIPLTHNSLSGNLAGLREAHAAIARRYPRHMPLRTTCGVIAEPRSAGVAARLAEPHRWRYRWLRKSALAARVWRVAGCPVVLGDIRREVDRLLDGENALRVVNVERNQGCLGAAATARAVRLQRGERTVDFEVVGPAGLRDAVLGGIRPGPVLVTNFEMADLDVLRDLPKGCPRIVGIHEGIGLWALVGGDAGRRHAWPPRSVPAGSWALSHLGNHQMSLVRRSERTATMNRAAPGHEVAAAPSGSPLRP